MGFYGFRGVSDRNIEKSHHDLKIQVAGYISDTYGRETEEWKDAQSKYEQIKGQFGKQIACGIGFDGLRGKLKEWGEDKERNAKRKEEHPEEIDEHLPALMEGDLQTAISINEDAHARELDLVRDHFGPEIGILCDWPCQREDFAGPKIGEAAISKSGGRQATSDEENQVSAVNENKWRRNHIEDGNLANAISILEVSAIDNAMGTAL